MLTFEEFFLKKKIDMAHFKTAEPVLFAEFSSHYPLMGEKSFDHTKKYWFNQLRRTYPLAVEIKPHAVKAEAISELAIQGMAAAAAQNLDHHPHQPKFTEDHLTELVDENVSVKEVSLAEEEKTIIESETEIPIAKPAFKPRFNAKNIIKPEVAVNDNLLKSEEEKSEEKKSEEPKPVTEHAKPAFKPRFNMQNIKKEPVKTVVENEIVTSVQEASDQPKPETESIKPAYKPLFQMKNVPKPPTE